MDPGINLTSSSSIPAGHQALQDGRVEIPAKYSIWRKYIHVLLPLAGYAAALFASRVMVEFSTADVSFAILNLQVGVITLAFLLSVLVYPSRDPPPQAAQDSVPWSLRSLANRLILNFMYSFLMSGRLELMGVLFDTGLAYLWTSKIHFQTFGTDAITSRGVKSEFISAVKGILAAQLASITSDRFNSGQGMLAIIAGFLRHLYRVNKRLLFVTIMDGLIQHLVYPPLGFVGRLKSLAILLCATTIATLLLLKTPFLTCTPGCPPYLYNLLVTHACYSQTSLNEPRALHKYAMCADEYRLGNPAQVASALTTGAKIIADVCSEADVKRAWVHACLITSGQSHGPQFGTGMCVTGPRALNIMLECMSKWNGTLPQFGRTV